jgi:broad specificity phosphatase PhoE
MFFKSILLASFIQQLPLQDMELLKNTSSENEQFIYIVRHGESTANVPDPNTGLLVTSGKSLEVPLTQKGKEQARAFAEQLSLKIEKNTEIVICSSTALRAQQTALCLLEELGKSFHCTLGESYGGLCELGQGPWEGLPKDETYNSKLKEWDRLSANDKIQAPKIEGGESYSEVIERAMPDIQKIIDKYKQKMIIIVSHHTAMNALAVRWNCNYSMLSKEPNTKLPSVSLANCDALIVKIPNGGSVDNAQVITHMKSGS